MESLKRIVVHLSHKNYSLRVLSEFKVFDWGISFHGNLIIPFGTNIAGHPDPTGEFSVNWSAIRFIETTSEEIEDLDSRILSSVPVESLSL